MIAHSRARTQTKIGRKRQKAFTQGNFPHSRQKRPCKENKRANRKTLAQGKQRAETLAQGKQHEKALVQDKHLAETLAQGKQRAETLAQGKHRAGVKQKSETGAKASAALIYAILPFNKISRNLYKKEKFLFTKPRK